MEKYILLIGIIFVLLGYIIIVIEFLKSSRKVQKNITGFDIAKEITSDYDNINIIESKEIIISNYHLKRNIIRLTPKTYESNNNFSLAISSLLSCISLTNNNYIKWIKKVLPSLDFINKTPIIILILSYIVHAKTDAKLGLIVGIVILIYQYFYLQILSDSIEVARNKKVVKKEITGILDKFYKANKVLFIATLIILLKFVLILIK